LIQEFSLKRVTPSAAVFDMEKLYWLNRHYIKQAPAERIERLAEMYFIRAGLLPEDLDERIRAWFAKVIALLAPSVNKLDELPERASLIFNYNAAEALRTPDNAEVLAAPKAADVLAAFAEQVQAAPAPLTPERFKEIMNAVKERTGAKGKDLYHPVRIVFTGSHSGPEFDKLIPILEQGAELGLPKHVMNVRERLDAFQIARS